MQGNGKLFFLQVVLGRDASLEENFAGRSFVVMNSSEEERLVCKSVGMAGEPLIHLGFVNAELHRNHFSFIIYFDDLIWNLFLAKNY